MYALPETPACFERVSLYCGVFANVNSRKWWIAHGLHAAGTVVVDEGAYRAIGRRESGGRLLPAGVLRVEGPFAAHQCVRIVVRRKRRFPPAPLIAEPVSVAVTPARMSPTQARHDLHHVAVQSAVAQVQTISISAASSPDSAPQPGTPQIQPTLSLSSSVASLDPLSRTGPSSPAMRAADRNITSLGDRMSELENGSGNVSGDASSASAATHGAAVDEWEEVEVGKGLAQYNSVAIDRIKGMKR